MKTVWGEQLHPASVLQEYPRPQLVRGSYENLNGLWDYAITKTDVRPDTWDGKILVPFSPEAELSGVNRTLHPGEMLWYRRMLAVPAIAAGMRLLLHIGACDQRAKIFCNGQYVFEHVGGYTAFSADLTAFLHPGENELILQVKDDLEASQLSRGKQSSKRGSIWYTPQSGIWQTVWCESVPENYVKSLRLTPDLDAGVLRWHIEADGAEGARVTVRAGDTVIAEGRADENGDGVSVIPAAHLRPWSPEDPFLYDVDITLGEDRVASYFGMRKFSLVEQQGRQVLALNNEPYFQTGLLDQGYWSDGLYTPPSDEAMVCDIRTMKELGFNMLRKHIKIEPLRWYYHCDRLGMLVWQDMPSGGGQYNLLTISAPLITGIHLKDSHYRLFARTDAQGREDFTRELTELITQLQNCPCIVLWVPFNEGWGQFDAKNAVRLIRRLDPTRLIDHASGWHDQGVSDVKSLHVYFKPYRFRPDKKGRAVVLSEFGGYNLPVAGHTWNTKNFGYKGYQTPEALGEAVKTLYETQIIPARRAGLAADVYTQLSDVEDEVNGFVTYDRRVEKLPEALMQAIARELKGE